MPELNTITIEDAMRDGETSTRHILILAGTRLRARRLFEKAVAACPSPDIAAVRWSNGRECIYFGAGSTLRIACQPEAVRGLSLDYLLLDYIPSEPTLREITPALLGRPTGAIGVLTFDLHAV